jgi:hypothetical protein
MVAPATELYAEIMPARYPPAWSRASEKYLSWLAGLTSVRQIAGATSQLDIFVAVTGGDERGALAVGPRPPVPDSADPAKLAGAARRRAVAAGTI